MGLRGWTVVIGLALLVAAPARATEDQATAKARILLRAAIVDYDEGRYAEAASGMERAYQLRPVPDLQYNLAQCYERLNRLEDAIRAYEAYLAAPHSVADDEAVRKRIANLRARAQAAAEGKQAPAASTEKVVFKTIVVYREAPPRPGRVLRWSAIGLGILGAAGLATGIAFAVLTSQASDDVENGGSVVEPPVFGGELRAREDAGWLYPIGTGVGFGVAALCVGGAVGLVYAGRKVDREAQKAREAEQAFVPSVSPFLLGGGMRGGGLVVGGRF